MREPDDWAQAGRPDLVWYRRTRTVFQLQLRRGKQPHETLAIEDFEARLVHVCSGTVPPVKAELRVLSKEAVLMALHQLGLVIFAEEETEGGPEPEEAPFLGAIRT